MLRGALLLGTLAAQAGGHGILTVPAPRTGTDVAGGNKGNVGPYANLSLVVAASSSLARCL